MKKETKVKIVKVAVGIAAGVCAAAVTTAALKGLMPIEDAETTDKVMYKIGISIISSMVAEQAGSYTAKFVGAILAPGQSEPMTGSVEGLANA